MKRPFAVIGLSLMFSIILASLLTETVAVCVGAGLFLTATACLFLRKLPKALPVCLLVNVAGIFIYCCIIRLIYMPLSVYAGEFCEIRGVVTKTEQTQNGTHRAYLQVEEVNGKDVSFDLRLTVDESWLSAYDEICFTTTLKEPTNVAGSNFNNINYLHSKGIAFTAYASYVDIDILGKGERPWYGVFDDLRGMLLDALDHMLGERSGIAKAVMLGEKTGLTTEQNDSFRRIGVSHLFAVSGLHLSVLLSAFLWLAKRTMRHRVPVLIGGILMVLFFMALTGFSVSVLRAGIMVLLMLTAQLIFREADPLNSLGIAVVLLLAINPLTALDVGFEMSVCATLGLVTVGARLSHWIFQIGKKPSAKTADQEMPEEMEKEDPETEEESESQPAGIRVFLTKIGERILRFVLGSLATSLAANAFLLPIYSHYFGSISLLMPLTNLLLIPASSGVLIFSMLSSLLYLIPGVGAMLAFLPSKAALLLIAFVDGTRAFLDGIPGQSIGVSGTLQQLTIFFLLLFVLLWLFSSVTRVRGKAVALCCAVVLMISMVTDLLFLSPRTNIHFWGNDSAVCLLINQGRDSTVLSVEGYYADSMAEQFCCEDGCLRENEIVPLDKGGWNYETIVDGEGRTAAIILSHGDGKILLVDRPDEVVASAISDRNEYYGLICFNAGKNSATNFLTTGRVGEQVILCNQYGDVPETREKLQFLGYTVTDITSEAGLTITLTPQGTYSLKGTRGD